ncbi:MAG: long-chain fatty acid--CoA ligase [Myxococcales bacterium]|nr:long-chain fatty acid--CoA ligase [Myxococcales bacterium]
MMEARARRTPDLPALRCKVQGIWRTWTWLDWLRMGQGIAAALVRPGGPYAVARGERVALLAPSRLEWALCDLGIALAGAVSVPIYPSSTPAQAAFILKDSGATVAIVADPADVQRLRGLDHGVRRFVVLSGRGGDGVDGFEQLQADGAAALAAPPGSADAPGAAAILAERAAATELADPFTIVYTSGTTGTPRGVVLSHRNLVYEAWAIKNVIAADRSDEQLMVLPLAHVFARHLLWGAVEQGSVTAFAPAGPDHLGALTAAFQEVAPTFMGAVPRFYDRFYASILGDIRRSGGVTQAAFERCMAVGRKVSQCRQRGQAVPGRLALKLAVADRLFFARIRQQFGGRLRFFVSGGAPLRREVAEFFHAVGILVLEGYGLTETTGATNVNRPDRFRFGTVGPAMPGCELRIADDGEVLVRGPGVMSGYHNLPEETAAALDLQGWLHTGDIGELQGGFLTITDRKKHIIVTSTGKHIAPQPLEGRLELCEGVAHALVLGDGRPYLTALVALDGPTLLALSQREGLGARTLAELAAHPRVRRLIQGHIDALNADLAGFEAIRRFAVLPDELAADERTPTGKLRRKTVAARHAALVDGLYAAGSDG